MGDGTTSVVVLAGELLKEAEQLVNQKIHPMTIIAGAPRPPLWCHLVMLGRFQPRCGPFCSDSYLDELFVSGLHGQRVMTIIVHRGRLCKLSLSMLENCQPHLISCFGSCSLRRASSFDRAVARSTCHDQYCNDQYCLWMGRSAIAEANDEAASSSSLAAYKAVASVERMRPCMLICWSWLQLQISFSKGRACEICFDGWSHHTITAPPLGTMQQVTERRVIQRGYGWRSAHSTTAATRRPSGKTCSTSPAPRSAQRS